MTEKLSIVTTKGGKTFQLQFAAVKNVLVSHVSHSPRTTDDDDAEGTRLRIDKIMKFLKSVSFLTVKNIVLL